MPVPEKLTIIGISPTTDGAGGSSRTGNVVVHARNELGARFAFTVSGEACKSWPDLCRAVASTSNNQYEVSQVDGFDLPADLVSRQQAVVQTNGRQQTDAGGAVAAPGTVLPATLTSHDPTLVSFAGRWQLAALQPLVGPEAMDGECVGFTASFFSTATGCQRIVPVVIGKSFVRTPGDMALAVRHNSGGDVCLGKFNGDRAAWRSLVNRLANADVDSVEFSDDGMSSERRAMLLSSSHLGREILNAGRGA
jgi:hypothetical protein